MKAKPTVKEKAVKKPSTVLHRVLACDPGKTNFAIVVFDMDVNKLNKLLDAANTKFDESMVPMQILSVQLLSDFLNMEKYRGGFDGLITTFDTMVKTHNPSFIFSERFQGRGMKGDLHEVCITAATMLSTIGRLHNEKCVVDVVSALKWKNVIGSILGNLYERTKDFKFIKVHHVDAIMLGYYLYLSNTYTKPVNGRVFQWLSYVAMSTSLLSSIDSKIQELKNSSEKAA